MIVRTLGVHETMVLALKKTRDARLNIRTTLERKELIAKAAKRENKNISDFVLENALSAAEAVVVDDANSILDRRRFKLLVAALDAKPRKISALRKLLTEPSVFDAK